MAKLPEKIIVLAFNPACDHQIVLNILKEFFETFPYILVTLDDEVLPDCIPIFELNDVKKLQYFLED